MADKSKPAQRLSSIAQHLNGKDEALEKSEWKVHMPGF